MKKKFKLGVIGAGFMASAIIKGALSSGFLSPTDITVYDVNAEKLNEMEKIGIKASATNYDLAENSEFILFAIKPQESTIVLNSIKETNALKFISIMAGVKKSKIKAYFPDSFVARCMPNTPCSIQRGAIGVDLSDYNSENDLNFIKNLLSNLGSVVSVPENLLGAVTGVSGSSPAYFYTFINGIIKAGVKNGLDYSQAKTLAVSTMIGAGEMIKTNENKSIEELISAVCSKGGTTIEAIKVYSDNNLDEITENAVSACIKRSNELENL